jgi:hypothetical protein
MRYGQAKLLVDRGLTPCYPTFTRACIISHLSKVKNYTAGGVLPRTTFPLFQHSATSCFGVAKVVNGQWVALVNKPFPFICGAPAKPTPTG